MERSREVKPFSRSCLGFVDEHYPLAVESPELSILMSPFDLKRLESYANNMLDYHVVLDLLPTVASLYFEGRLGDDVRLSAVQASILLGLGLQRKTIEEVEVYK
jgi:N-acetyltransferase 10